MTRGRKNRHRRARLRGKPGVKLYRLQQEYLDEFLTSQAIYVARRLWMAATAEPEPVWEKEYPGKWVESLPN